MNKGKYPYIFIFSDLVTSGLTWYLFYLYRKHYIETLKFSTPIPFHPDLKFFISLMGLLIFWLILHYISGAYTQIRRKNPAVLFSQTLITSLLGSIFIFFTLLLDDIVIDYRSYYQSLLVLFFLQFLLTLTFRSIHWWFIRNCFKKGKDHFKVLIYGNPVHIKNFTDKHKQWISQSFFKLYPFNSEASPIQDLDLFIHENNLEEIWILPEEMNNQQLENLLLKTYRLDVFVRIPPELYANLTLPIKFSGSFDAPLLLLTNNPMQNWQQSMKLLFDLVVSLLAILLLSPIIIILGLAIKINSRGPILYRQPRIGKNGRTFHILKFRSMFQKSEPDGPQLSSRNDHRITPVGRFMRKRRLDEIPNFINVIKGEMSLVGPRPERKHYIDQIITRAPQYAKLHLVKPGITSWGQVRFGYAENIDEMIQRMKFDLVYIDNINFYVDFQILFWTIRTVIKGQGI